MLREGSSRNIAKFLIKEHTKKLSMANEPGAGIKSVDLRVETDESVISPRSKHNASNSPRFNPSHYVEFRPPETEAARQINVKGGAAFNIAQENYRTKFYDHKKANKTHINQMLTAVCYDQIASKLDETVAVSPALTDF